MTGTEVFIGIYAAVALTFAGIGWWLQGAADKAPTPRPLVIGLLWPVVIFIAVFVRAFGAKVVAR